MQFLFYNDSSRSQVALEKLIMAMTRDVSNTVSEVYVTSVELASGPPVKVFFLMLYLVAFVNAKSPLRRKAWEALGQWVLTRVSRQRGAHVPNLFQICWQLVAAARTL